MHQIHIKWKNIIKPSFYRFRGKFRIFPPLNVKMKKVKEGEGEGGEKEKRDGAFSISNKIQCLDS